MSTQNIDTASLGSYLEQHIPGFKGPVSAEKFAGGQSNPTFKLTAGGKSYVLRRKPPGELLKSAHAVDREFRVISALRDTDVPVPRTYVLCEDEAIIGSMFYIMEYMEGRILWDPVIPEARESSVPDLPSDCLAYLMGSRYCETDKLSQVAWDLFGTLPPGWRRVQAICDFVHDHIHFDYMQARATRSAFEVFHERVGVCRDFAHLAVAFCRCLNIPARYVNGHLGDIGVPVVDPMDFSAWMEVFLEGQWHTFDPRNNVPRIGRIVVARGRDAADVPLINSFGPHLLKSFRVWTYAVEASQ